MTLIKVLLKEQVELGVAVRMACLKIFCDINEKTIFYKRKHNRPS